MISIPISRVGTVVMNKLQFGSGNYFLNILCFRLDPCRKDENPTDAVYLKDSAWHHLFEFGLLHVSHFPTLLLLLLVKWARNRLNRI